MFFKNIKSAYSGLPRSVYIIFIARVVNCIGNFVFPFMTLLLTSKVGMSEEQVGTYILLASILQVPGSLIGGKLADHTGRKKIMIFFMCLGSLCFVPCALFLNSSATLLYIPPFLILSSFFGSIGGPAAGAMMNDLTIPQNRQAAFSLLYLGVNAGTAVGSVIAGFLFNNYMKLLFLGDTATTFIAIVLLALYVKETRPTSEDMEKKLSEHTDEKAESGGLLAALLRRPRLLIFSFVDVIYYFVYAQNNFGIPLQAKSVFGNYWGPKYYGTFNMVNCLEVIFFTTFITIITKKLRAVYNISIAAIFYAVGFGMLYFVRDYWMFVLSTILWTIGEILHATNVSVYIADHTPISHRGRFNSIINIITGTGWAISPLIMGRFIERNGVIKVWPVMFVASMSASLLMFILGALEGRKASSHAEVEAS